MSAVDTVTSATPRRTLLDLKSGGSCCTRYVIYFIRAWNSWATKHISNADERRRATLTSETVLDVESALSAVVNLIGLCAEGKFGSALIYLRRLGSDMCEALFARISGWIGAWPFVPYFDSVVDYCPPAGS